MTRFISFKTAFNLHIDNCSIDNSSLRRELDYIDIAEQKKGKKLSFLGFQSHRRRIVVVGCCCGGHSMIE